MNNIQGVRLYASECQALKSALEGFDGEVYVFGSRVDCTKKGGDIDLLLKPSRTEEGSWALKTAIASKFACELDQSLDVIVWDENNIFCQEIMKNAKRIDPRNL